MKQIVILILLVALSLNSNSQNVKIVEEEIGKRGVICLSGFSLAMVSWGINPEPYNPFYKNETRIVPFCFGVSLIIGGIIPDKKGRFYNRPKRKK